MTTALNLTALAAEAVAELAATRKVQPEQVLRSLTAGQFGKAELRTLQVAYPASMDDYDWAMTEAKGWIEIAVRSIEGDTAITFYDPVRLAQEVNNAMTGRGYFAESTIVVVPAVTREAIEAVIARMARSGFADIG